MVHLIVSQRACSFICDCTALDTICASCAVSFIPFFIFSAMLHTVLAPYPASRTAFDTIVGLDSIISEIAVIGSIAPLNQATTLPHCAYAPIVLPFANSTSSSALSAFISSAISGTSFCIL